MVRRLLVACLAAVPAAFCDYSVTYSSMGAQRAAEDPDQIAFDGLCQAVADTVKTANKAAFQALWTTDPAYYPTQSWEAFIFHKAFGYPPPSPYVGPTAVDDVMTWAFANVFPFLNPTLTTFQYAAFSEDKSEVFCFNNFVFVTGESVPNMIHYYVTPDLKLWKMLTFEPPESAGIPPANFQSIAEFAAAAAPTAGAPIITNQTNAVVAYTYYLDDFFRAAIRYTYTLPSGDTRAVAVLYQFNDHPCARWCNVYTCGSPQCSGCTSCFGLVRDLHCSPWCNVW